MELKYFYYISKTKISMLLPQVKRKRFSISSINPKLEMLGISISAELSAKQNESLVADTLRLIDGLKRGGAIQEVSETQSLNTSTFYHDQGVWHSGLFYFAGGYSEAAFDNRNAPIKFNSDEFRGNVAVVYLLWRTFGNAIILLVGSPDNILGEKIVGEGVYVRGSSGAMDAVNRFVVELQGEDSQNVMLKNEWRSLKRKISSSVNEIKFTDVLPQIVNNSSGTPVPGMRFTDYSNGYLFASFCFNQLQDLPQENTDTAFRIFTVHNSPRNSFLSELIEHYRQSEKATTENLDGDRDEKYLTKLQAVLTDLQGRGFQQYKTVYIGSPLYTAKL